MNSYVRRLNVVRLTYHLQDDTLQINYSKQIEAGTCSYKHKINHKLREFFANYLIDKLLRENCSPGGLLIVSKLYIQLVNTFRLFTNECSLFTILQ